MSRNLRNSYCLFSFAAVESLYGRFLSLNMFLIGTNEMRCFSRHAYSDHEKITELGAPFLAWRIPRHLLPTNGRVDLLEKLLAS